MYKEFSDNRKYLMADMMYWAKINEIEIDKAVLFFNLEIEDMINTKFNPWGPVAMYESAESEISPLMVITRTIQNIEEEIWPKEASAESQGTITQ